MPATAQVLVTELQSLIDSHPQIQAKQKSVSAAGEGVRAAWSGYLPTVRVMGDSGPEYIDSPDRRDEQGKPFYRGRETTSLVVTQRLFDGFQTDSAVGAAKVSKGISESDLRDVRQSALLEGVLAYVDVLRQARLIQLARDSERKIHDQLNLEDERVQKGSGIASDVLAAKQRLQIAKERRVNFEGAFQTAVAKYSQVFGHAPDSARFEDPPVPAALIPPKLEDAVEAAQHDNPKLESAGKTIALSSERKKSAEAGYYPNIDLVGRADYQNDTYAQVGVRRDWSILITASWELFSGFKTDAQVAQASFEHAAAMDSRNYADRKVSETVKIAWHRLKTAHERISLLENAAVLAEELWTAQKKRHEAGKATVQDVLDEETKINDARIQLTQAYYDMIQHSYELLGAMGRLEVDTIETAPKNTSRENLSPVGQQSSQAGSTKPMPPKPALATTVAATRAEAIPGPANAAETVPAYIPVSATTFGDDLPDGSPASLQGRSATTR